MDSTLGTGTTMRIYLPLIEEAETEEVAEDEASRSRGCETVMVVEDDARLRRIARQLLEEYGYAVVSCEDGLEALRRLESYDDPVHLILTDVIMPHMGGRELVERVQRRADHDPNADDDANGQLPPKVSRTRGGGPGGVGDPGCGNRNP